MLMRQDGWLLVRPRCEILAEFVALYSVEPLQKSHVERYGVRVTTGFASLPCAAGSQLLASRNQRIANANRLSHRCLLCEIVREPLTWLRGASRELHQLQHPCQGPQHLEARRRAQGEVAVAC